MYVEKTPTCLASDENYESMKAKSLSDWPQGVRAYVQRALRKNLREPSISTQEVDDRLFDMVVSSVLQKSLALYDWDTTALPQDIDWTGFRAHENLIYGVVRVLAKTFELIEKRGWLWQVFPPPKRLRFVGLANYGSA